LLLALLVVQAGVPQAEWLLAITGVVVVVSVVVHGSSATPLSAWYGRRIAASEVTMAEERESTFTGLFEPDADEIIRIKPDELAALLTSKNPPIVLDVRARAHHDRDDAQIPGSIRVLPDQIREWAADQQQGKVIVAYCSCPDEASSGRVSRQLIALGFDARALQGGYEAWREDYPVEPNGSVTISPSDLITSHGLT
jgi:rhodanese-related sulfurtransferase